MLCPTKACLLDLLLCGLYTYTNSSKRLFCAMLCLLLCCAVLCCAVREVMAPVVSHLAAGGDPRARRLASNLTGHCKSSAQWVSHS
jgi:hypothetical protein